MKHNYRIQGMTCNGCRSIVEEKLGSINGVEGASVTLETADAIIEMREHIDTARFQDAIPEKYRISETFDSDVRSSTFSKSGTNGTFEKTKLRQLRPLLLILLYITTTSLSIHRDNWNTIEIMLDFMGLFYIVFSFFKLLDLKGFTNSFSIYDPLAKIIPVYGPLYPFIETVLGLMLLFRFSIVAALILTIIILGITSFGVARSLLDNKKIQCACLGTALKLPMTEATLIENTIMIFMAIITLNEHF